MMDPFRGVAVEGVWDEAEGTFSIFVANVEIARLSPRQFVAAYDAVRATVARLAMIPTDDD